MYDFDEIIDRHAMGSIKWKEAYPEYLMLSTADMDFKTCHKIENALANKIKQGIYAYEFRSDEFLESIVSWYQRRFNYHFSKEDIIITPGVWPGIRIILDSVLKENNNILAFAPSFFPLSQVIDKTKSNLYLSDLVLRDNHFEIDFIDFEQQIIKNNIKTLVLINPHNPTGKVFKKDELLKIIKICQVNDVLIISDEVQSNIVFEPHIYLPIASLSDYQKIITITSGSKTFNLQGLTLASIIVKDRELYNLVYEGIKGYDMEFATNILSMEATKTAYNECEDWLKELKIYLTNNQNYVLDFFKDNDLNIKPIKLEGSYTMYLDCSKLNLNAQELEDFFINKAKVYLTFEASYDLSEGKFVRLNIGCPLSILKQALKRIKQAYEAK